jgi:methylglutaconyl-CoA hydratase
MTYETLRFEQQGKIATITLNRPEKRNAISAEMITDLLAALDEAASSSAFVTILTGSGKAFCAGMDIDGLRSLVVQSPQDHLEDSHRMAAMFRRIYSFPKPLIAAVNGAAIAGGCGIATLADFTLAVPEAKFGYTEVRIGFIPALVSVFLRRQVGGKQARDLLLTGKIIDAHEAFRLGLVTEVVPAEKLMARAGEVADSLLAVSPTSVLRTKKLLYQTEHAALDEELDLAIQENASIRSTEDFREGVSSFLEKRPPRWTGR